MASTEAVYCCYYYQFELADNSFKYFDNRKVNQPRHQCSNCHKLFTLGSHDRPQGTTYAKKRSEDPDELKSLSRKCCHCSMANNASFKYYNNNNHLQPHFKCLSCGKQFQMQLMGVGGKMHLVHTSNNQRQATGRRKKKAVPLPFNPVMLLEPNMNLIPEKCREDEEYASFLEDELIDEDEHAPNVNPISYHANVENGSFLPESSIEDAQLLALLELESSTNENDNADPNTLKKDGLPLDFSTAEKAEFLAFLEAGFLTNGNVAPLEDNAANVVELPPLIGNDAN